MHNNQLYATVRFMYAKHTAELEFEWKITIFLQTRPVIMCFFEEESVDLKGKSFFFSPHELNSLFWVVLVPALVLFVFWTSQYFTGFFPK